MNVAIPRVQPGVDRPGYELITSAVHQNTLPHEAIKHHHLSRRDTSRLGGWIQSDQCLPKRGWGGWGGFLTSFPRVTRGGYRLRGWLLMHRTLDLDPAAA